jgi:hypothetical protein
MKKFLLFVLCFGLIITPSFSSSQIVINEIMYNPKGSDAGYEWIELKNIGSSDIDVTGWKFTESGTDHGLALKQGSFQIYADGFAVVVDDIAKFLSVVGYSGNIYDSTFSLINDGESLEIKDKNKVIVDEVFYLKTQGAYDNGNSLQKNDAGWISANPTPGAVNATVDTEGEFAEETDSNDTATDTSTSTTTSTSTATSTTKTTTSSGGSSYYVYSSSVSLSTYEPLSLNVEAGRERLGFLHTPLEFKSYTKDKKTGKNISGAKYLWTFGDGTSSEGDEIIHTYLFPGEYNVVLNSSIDNEDAVDITKVKIIEPKVKIVLSDSYAEFINENSTDLNIGEWKIKGKDKEYLIPKDTIISANASIKIPESVLSNVLGGEKVALFYPDNQIAFESGPILSKEKEEQLVEISQKLLSIKNELDYAYAQEGNYVEFADSEGGGGVFGADTKTDLENESKDELLANSISAPTTKSVVSKIFDFFATMFK